MQMIALFLPFAYFYCRVTASRPRGEMDIISVFETGVPGSNPGGGTWQKISAAGDFFAHVPGAALFCKQTK